MLNLAKFFLITQTAYKTVVSALTPDLLSEKSYFIHYLALSLHMKCNHSLCLKLTVSRESREDTVQK